MDNNQPSPPNNDRLIHAMQAVAMQDGPTARQELYEAMLDSTFLVPTTESVAPGMRTIQPGEQVVFLGVEGADGKLGWPFFTHRKALLAWQPDLHFYGLRARSVFQMATQYGIDHLLINPAGPVGGQVMQWEIEALAKGQIPADSLVTAETIVHDTQILIGAPAESHQPSEELVHGAKLVLADHPLALAGYLFMMGLDAQPLQLVLGVRFSAEANSEIVEREMSRMAAQMGATLHSQGEAEQPPLGLLVITEDLLPVVANCVAPVFERT